jgi:hypothetical protein
MNVMKFVFGAIIAIALSTPAFAATLISTASGNINATATWSVVDTAGTNALLNSEAANTALTTSPVASSTFTPAAETISGFAVKLASVAATPSGTITLELLDSTTSTAKCTRTVNVADLVSANPTTAEGGWVNVTCPASFATNGTDTYEVLASTSVASQVNLFSDTGTDWDRLLVTTGTKTNGPAAGDDFLIYGNLTGAGTHTAFTVTVNTTSNINYGADANTLVAPSVAVGQFGTLAYAVTASTNFDMEFAGPLVIYNGGTFTVGTAASPVPATSNATLTMNSATEGDTGVNVRNGGTFDSAGSSGGRNVVKTTLTATANSGATSLTTAVATGWLAGDSIYVAGTSITDGAVNTYQGEAATVSSVSGNVVTISTAMVNTHTATQLNYTSSQTNTAYLMNMFPDVVLLNRNVIIQGATSTANGYLFFQAASNAAMTWTEFSQISGTAAGSRGLEVDVGPPGTFSLTNSSVINSQDTALELDPNNPNFGGTQGAPLTIQHVTLFNVANNTACCNTLSALVLSTSTAPTSNPFWKFDDIAVVFSGNGIFSAQPLVMNSMMGQFTNISITGSGNSGNPVFFLNCPYGAASFIGGNVGNVWGPINSYSNLSNVFDISGAIKGCSGTIHGYNIWHEQGRFTPSAPSGNLTFDPFFEIDSTFGIYEPSETSTNTFRNGVIGFDTANIGLTPAIQLDAVNSTLFLDNMELCPNGLVGGVNFVACTNLTQNGKNISVLSDIIIPSGTVGNPGGGDATPATTAKIFLRNSSSLNLGTLYPTQDGNENYFTGSFVVQDCEACTPVKHAAWVAGGFLSYDTAITHTSGFSERMTPKTPTFSAFISGFNLTTSVPNLSAALNVALGSTLYSNGVGFIPGTMLTAPPNGNPNTNAFMVTQSQTVGSSGSPAQFQLAPNGANSPPRMQSAPGQMGTKIAVASGVSTAQACVWLRPSLSTDPASTWGTAAVTYNGDNPRMIVRQNPYMGVQADTVLATSSLTAGTWTQFCATLPTAPADGEFEVVVDADQTFTSNAGGSVNVTEWSCTVCSNSNNSQFWGNGTPTNSLAPASSGGGTIGIIGSGAGWLLKRDVDPASNDNDPMWLEKAA